MIMMQTDAPKHTPTEFISRYYSYAKETERKTGINACFILAQAALESGWGASAPGNLFFGIKAGPNQSEDKRQLVRTREIHTCANKPFPEILSIKKLKSGKYEYIVRDWFRKYDNPEESFTDYARLLLENKRYASALKVKEDPYRFADAIAKAGYATHPLYATTLKNTIRMIEKQMLRTNMEKRSLTLKGEEVENCK